MLDHAARDGLRDKEGAAQVSVEHKIPIVPGDIECRLADVAAGVIYENQEWVDYLIDRIPVKRPGDVHDLDGAVVFLASESSRYITGQTLLVDGGISTGAMRATVSNPSKGGRS